ncbi:glycosyltransferase family 2 protein [Agromyces sp. SYSU T0242]|uniref:glycosyltransferase family 2 protein n=1 Tax=Agromyces litoreus TaxID=3158561 RepID=UPI00339464F9
MDEGAAEPAEATGVPARDRVSVVIGTHNGARFVADQVRTVLAQTRPVDEIVVSDDASTDDTLRIVEDLVAAHRANGATVDLRIIRNDVALGVTANFEQALRAATGDLVALADQDDLWRPDRIARALEALAARPEVDLVASDADLVGPEGEALGADLFGTLGIDDRLRRRVDGEAALEELLRRNLLTGATMLVRRRLVERAAPFPGSWVHDEWLAVVAAASGAIAVLPDRLIGYRQHGANQIGVSSLGWRGRLERLRAPRTDRNARLLARAQALADRLPAIATGRGGADAAALGIEVGDKLAHEEVRSSIPASRVRRLGPVLREWRTGRYRRYGLGAQDVLRDLVQPV